MLETTFLLYACKLEKIAKKMQIAQLMAGIKIFKISVVPYKEHIFPWPDANRRFGLGDLESATQGLYIKYFKCSQTFSSVMFVSGNVTDKKQPSIIFSIMYLNPMKCNDTS